MKNAWWTQMTNTRRFIEAAAGAAASYKSVVICIPEDIPWYNAMINEVQDSLNRRNANNAFECIDCPDTQPGEFLMNRYCSKQQIADYRPGKSYAQFLASGQSFVLNDKFIWIRNVQETKLHEWIDFITEYNKKMEKGNHPAVFLLEIHNPSIFTSNRKFISRICYDDYVQQYDYFTYAAVCASSVQGIPDYLTPYLAELAAALAGYDLELSSYLVNSGLSFLQDPSAFYLTHANIDNYSKEMEKSLERKIWEVQLKTLFPKVEDYRRSLIEDYYEEICNSLPMPNGYGGEISSAEQVEIGQLTYLTDNGMLKLTQTQSNILHALRDARNNLAHFHTVEFEIVEQLLR